MQKAGRGKERSRSRSPGAMLQYLLEHSLNEVYVLDAESLRFKYVSSGTLKNIGYTLEELRSVTPTTIEPSLTEGDYRDMVRPLVAGEREKIVFQTEHRRKDGSSYPAEVHMQFLESHGMAVFLAFALDFTERRLADEALKESERKYRELVEHANSIILRWTPDGRISFLNEFGQRFFGYTQDEIRGRHVMGTIVPGRESGGRDLKPLMEQICMNPAAFEQNINENMLRSGEHVWIAWTNKIVMDQQGLAVEILSIGSDITARKLAEEEIRRLHEELRHHAAELEQRVEERTRKLRETVEALHAEAMERARAQAQVTELNASLERRASDLKVANRHLQGALDKAESADRVKSAFLAAMSHELRTPLNSVIGFTGAMLSGLLGDIADEQREVLEIVQRSGQHLLALINDVLDLSKLEAGEMRVFNEAFDLARVVREAVQSMEQQAAAKGLSLKLEGAGDSLAYRGDARRVAQILINLISNAIKFTQTGGVAVKLAPAASGDYIEIEVADTGIGILASDLELIFREFEQLDSGLARENKGTGLGLTLSRKMARLMGGDVLVKSTRGKGSTFTLELPVNGGAARPPNAS